MSSQTSSSCSQPSLNASDRKSTRLNSSHGYISYAVFCLKKKKILSDHKTKLDLTNDQSKLPNRSLQNNYDQLAMTSRYYRLLLSNISHEQLTPIHSLLLD